MAMPQQEWQPTLNEQQTRQLINAYNKKPQAYTPYLEKIRNHAYYHNVPFYEGEFSILEAIKQAGAGVVEGFTTLNLLEHPDNQWESIIRNVGHLVGFAPGMITSPLIKMGIKSAALIPKRGIPLAVAEDFFLPGAKKYGKKFLSADLVHKTKAGQAVSQFLSTPLAKDVATGAFNLGVASGISSWQHGVDAMMDSLFHGAIAGGVFKMIGNKINLDDKQAQTFARGLAGSLFMGLPDTVRGGTVPDQVYNYLLGAYFGGKELSWKRTQAKKITQENLKMARTSQDPYLEQTLDPTRFESWKEAPKEVKPLLYEEAKAMTGIDLLGGEKPEALGYELLEKLGLSKEVDKTTDKEAPKAEGFTTEKGSTYVVEKGNRTTRTKEARPEHPGDEGVKTKSNATIYLDKKDLPRINSLIRSGDKIINMELGKDLILNKDGLTIKGENFKGSKDPKIGLHPFEIWTGKKDGKKMIAKVHPGNEITKLEISEPIKKPKAKAVKETPKVKQKYLLTSGQRGLESTISKEAEKRGVKTVQVKLLDQRPVGKFGKGEVIDLKPNTLDAQDSNVRLAIDNINKRVNKTKQGKLIDISKYKGGATGPAMMYLKRDAAKMKFADSIVIAGELNGSLSELKGMQRVVGQLAVDSGKDIYVFDKKYNTWFKYNKEAGNPLTKEAGVFETMDIIPDIGDRTAFFGPELHTRADISAIQNLLEKQANTGLEGEMPINTRKKENSELMRLDDISAGEGFEGIRDNSLSGIINNGLYRNKDFIKNFTDMNKRTSEVENVIKTALDTYSPYKSTRNDKNKHETNSRSWIKEIEAKVGYKLPEELKGDLRKWLVREKHGKLIRVAISDGTVEGTEVLSRDTPYTKNNTLKNDVAPKSIIEEILEPYSKTELPTQPAPLKPETTKELKLNKIISGFQIGVDQKGLEIGKEFGYETGGTAPKGFFTAKGKQPDLAKKYGLSEVSEDVTKAYTGREKFYGPRTEKNIIDSDGTIVWGNAASPGSKLTINLAKKHNKPVIVNPTSSEMRNWLINNNIETLNTAGNRIPPPGFKNMMREAIAPKPATEKGPRYTQSKAGVRHVPELTGKDLTNVTKEVRADIEGSKDLPGDRGRVKASGHKSVWYGPRDYEYFGAYHKARKMPDNIRELKNEVEDALGLPRDYYDSVLMNKLPKNTKIPAHQDNEGIFIQKDKTIGSVGVLSLGGESVIDIQKPRGKSVEKHTIKSGDVYELPAGQFQATKIDHYHEVGPSKTDRLSLTFRRTKFAPELTEAISQPVGVKPGPANVYIDAIDYNGQDIPIRRFVSKAANLLSAEKDSYGNYKHQTYDEAYSAAEKLLKQKTRNIVKAMHDKYDMHLWGGEGDKDRLVFVKHHPEADKVKLPANAIPKDLLDFAKDTYGTTKQQETRAMKSLIKYHEEINGVPIEQTIGKDKDGWINNTIKLNKRLPVILNTGWRGDKTFINDRKQVGNLRLTDNGNYKGVIVRDAKELKNILGVKNSDLLQITDGSIITESATLNGIQKDRGGLFQGQEKSTLVYNGLLGKYMQHKTLPEGNQMMRDFENSKPGFNDGINFIIYDSAAKQKGNLPTGNYEIKNGKLELTEGAEVFEIDPGALRYNYGVYDGPSNFGVKNGVYKGIGVPKQTLLTPNPDMLVKTDVKHQEDFFNTLVRDAFNGSKEGNEAIQNYRKEIATNKAAIPGTEAEIVRDHFHQMGVKEIQDIMTKPGHEKLAQEMLLEMFNIDRRAQERIMMEGEGHLRHTTDELNNIADFTSTAENIIKHASALEMPAMPLFLGKYTKSYVDQVVNKWLTDRVFRPKVKNSIKSRMRPYDKWLVEKFPELNSDDLAIKKHGVPAEELVFLGELYKEAPFYDPVKKKMSTMGETWDAYKKTDVNKEPEKALKYKDTFDGLVIRVPQDSASGALVLRLAGFTGIKDHGSMLHGRAMEKLGGADLDADSDFIFFGGRHKDGTGHGFKKEWKDIYKAQKNEFIQDGKFIDVKEEWGEDIVLSEKNLKDLDINPNLFKYSQNLGGKYPYLQYSPSLRTFVGENTANSRELMPPIVSLTQNSKAAWSSVLNSPSKIDLIESGTVTLGSDLKTRKEPVMYRITRKPKATREDKIEQLTLSSALVRFTADPANVIGLVPYQKMKTLLDMTYYEPREYQIFNKKKGKWENYDQKTFEKELGIPKYAAMTIGSKSVYTPNVFKQSRYNLINDINKAFFGWNYNEGSRWTYEQKQNLIRGVENLTESERSSALPKFAHMMRDVDFRMSIYDRVKNDVYNKMHDKYTKVFRGLKDKDVYKRLLGRTRLDKPKSNQVQFMFDNKLNNVYFREQFANRGGKDIIEAFDKADIKRTWHRIKETDKYDDIIVKLNKSLRNAEDYLENAVWEMATTDLIINEFKNSVKAGKKISNKEMEAMLIAVEEIKEANSARYRQRQEFGGRRIEDESSLSHERDKFVQEMNRFLNKRDINESKGNAILDQAEIDGMIRNFKTRLSSKYAQNVFDYLLLGSLKGRKEAREIDNYMKESKNNPIKQQVLEKLFTEGAKSGTSQAAFNSREVSTRNIKNFFKKQMTMYDNTADPLLSKAPKKHIPTKAKEHLKKFEESEIIKDLDPIEQLKKANIEKSIIADIIGWDRLKKGKISPENKKIIAELADLIKSDPNFHPSKINRTLMGLYSYIDPFDPAVKSLDQMNATDFQNMINTYKQIKGGTIHQRLERNLPLLKKLSLKARNQLQFPLMVSNEQMANDITHVKSKKFLKDWTGKEPKEVEILYPTSWIEILQTQISRMDGIGESITRTKSEDIKNKFKFLSQASGEDGLALHNLAWTKRELQQQFKDSDTRKKYEDVNKKWEKIYNWDKMKDANYNLDIDGKGRKQYTGEQVRDIVAEKLETTYDNLQELNTGKLERISAKEYDKLPKKEKIKWERDIIANEYTKHPLEDYTIGFYDAKKTQRILNIEKFMEDLSKAFYEGPDKALEFAINVGSDGNMQLLKSLTKELIPFTKYVLPKPLTNEGKLLSTERDAMSIEEYNGLSYAKRKALEKQGWITDKEFKQRLLDELEMPLTGTRKGYMPHFWNDTKASKKIMDKELDKISAKYNKLLKNSPKDAEKITNQYIQEYKAALMNYKFQNGDYDLGHLQDLNTGLDMLVSKRIKESLIESERNRLDISNLPSITKRAGHTRKRENDKMEWIMDPAVHGIYVQNSVRGLVGGLTNILTRWTLNQANTRNYKKIVKPYLDSKGNPKKGKEKDYKEALEVVNNWDWFYQQYVKEAQGMTTIINPADYNNPNLHVATTPYGWFADNIWAKRINKVADTLGLLDRKKNLPKELQGLDGYDIQKMSNIEARFQLATLMTHPKTPINNIFGGSMHTFQSVGYEPLRKAYDYEYLQTINPKYKNGEEVYKDLAKKGITVELARHELGLDKNIKALNNQKFIDAVASKAATNTEFTAKEKEAIRKKYGVSKKIMDIAAKFMTIPERRLRRDAYLAHYIKAWERFGGAISNPDSPILVEIGKKGVKATQFLYSAPFRPAFARSGVGKIMSRFQLWAWNAVRFRNDVRKLAQRYGYKPGSEGMIKFERMITTDLFVMALGSMLMYSMFEQVIPAPYSWMQDTAQWIFGDENERDRAFFGTYPGPLAPLQLVTPPAARFPISVIREFAEDDYTKLSDYYMWTMFPFGRMARDLFHPEQSVFINPMRIPEKFFGFPLTGLAKETKRMREEEHKPLFPGQSISMFRN
jgi:alkylated DNA repair dioxygenase AlkB